MHRQGLRLRILQKAKQRRNDTNRQTHVHQRRAMDAAQHVKFYLGQIGNVNVGLAGKRSG